MNRRYALALLVLGSLTVAACASPAVHSACTSSADCAAGTTCVDRACVPRADGGAGVDAGRVDGGSSPDAGSGPDATGGVDAGAVCVPVGTTETVCDGRDDDCNGIVDDVDVGHDGICDCLAIGIIGSPGANPSSSFQSWLTSRGSTVTRFGTTMTETITPDVLAPYDVIVLDWLPRAYTPTEATALRDFVSAGGGLMSMTGHDGGPDRTNASSLLAAIGVEYTAGLVSGPVTMFVPHPLTTGLTSVTFEGGYHVGTTSTLTGTATVVASLPDGPVGTAVSLGTGRAYIWGDEWVEFDSQWSTMPEIAEFWTNAFGWLAPVATCRTLI